MKILVCIKQVPVLDAGLELDFEKMRLPDDPPVDYKINRFDEFALEEALQIRARIPGSRVHALSVGPPRVLESIQRAMGMGADHGVHIDYPREGFVNPRTIASLISQYARNRHFDLIITGVMAEDDMQGLVGPMTAAYSGLPCAVSVVRTRLQSPFHEMIVKSELEGGRRQTIRLSLPALITIQSNINQPRYPSLSNLLRSGRQPIPGIDAGAFIPPKPRERMECLSLPPRSKNMEFIEGSLEEKADTLIRILHKKSLFK